MKTFSKIAGFLTGFMLWLAASHVLAALLYLMFGTPFFLMVPLVAVALLLLDLITPVRPGHLYAVSQIGARMMYDNARQLLLNMGFPEERVKKARLTPSILRSEVAMSATNGAYHIPILVNDQQNGAIRPCEIRLNLQDIFVANWIGVYMGVGSATSTKPILYTYPNVTVFTTTTSADLYSIYNGILKLLIDNNQVLPAWDVLRHLKVPAIQELAAPYYATAPTQKDQVDFSEDSMYPVEPGIVMNGAANLDFTLKCPGAPATVLANSFICVIQRGILCQNVTSVQ